MHQSFDQKRHPGASSPSSSNRDAHSNREQGPAGLSVLTGSRLKQIAQAAPHQLKKFSDDDALLSRALPHLVVMLIIALAIGLSDIEWSWGRIGAFRPLKPTLTEAAATPATAQSGAPFTLPTQLDRTRNDIIFPAAVPHTIIPERARAEIVTHQVETGDTVSSIAAKFGLSPETIIWANSDLERNPDLLGVNQEVVVLPVNGVYHQVGGRDTIESIAATYQIEPAAIINYALNQIDPDEPVIQPGQWLVVPGGSKPYIPRAVTVYAGPMPEGAETGSGAFGWPASGAIFQDYWSGHPALDIADRLGAPVVAADSGYVVVAGWDDTGYGYKVVLDHGNGYQTLYAHLQAYYVEAGNSVTKGQQIGEMGSSGNSTGPHAHFEIRQGTIQRNPFGFLP